MHIRGNTIKIGSMHDLWEQRTDAYKGQYRENRKHARFVGVRPPMAILLIFTRSRENGRGAPCGRPSAEWRFLLFKRYCPL